MNISHAFLSTISETKRSDSFPHTLNPTAPQSSFLKAATDLKIKIEAFLKELKQHIEDQSTTNQGQLNIYAFEQEASLFVQETTSFLETLEKTISLDELAAQHAEHYEAIILHLYALLQSLTLLFKNVPGNVKKVPHSYNLPIREESDFAKSAFYQSQNLAVRSTEVVIDDSGLTFRKPAAEKLEMFEEESHSLLNSLACLHDQTTELQASIHNIAFLQSVLSAKLMQQEESIHHIHQETIHTRVNLDKGNAELQSAAKQKAGARFFFVIFMVLASLCLLFLDWFQE
eukprot:GCRY01004439.1.p1 GENE.GCRY01004439.1~~GCRY01004439.1.p1  ORF type:complete len:287 (+),score=54.05 GCRY01004439.1:166-1026(+)